MATAPRCPTTHFGHNPRQLYSVHDKSVAAALGITNLVGADRNRGRMLKKIKGEVNTRNGTNPDGWESSRPFFESAYAHFDAVRVAWRNPTMHIENSYHEREAEDIFNTVKALMRHLAARLDETGSITP